MDKELKQQLNECTSLMSMINLLNGYYTIDMPLKGLTKKFVIANLHTLIVKLKLKKRTDWQKVN